MTSPFAGIFEDARRDLEARGIEVHRTANGPAAEGALATFARDTGVELPRSFADFFIGFSNKYQFHWEHEGESGYFSMPSLEELASMHREWTERVAEFSDDPHSLDECMEAEFRDEAFGIWKRMRSWLPFYQEPDGDEFCVDLSSGKIVFNKHDWFDGFGKIAETNGLIAGDSLTDFLQNWALFYFQPMWFTDAPHEASMTELEWGDGKAED